MQQQQQSQYQGPERRQSQAQYEGEDRRKPDPGSPGMSMQDRKEEQAERVRQQEEKHHDRH